MSFLKKMLGIPTKKQVTAALNPASLLPGKLGQAASFKAQVNPASLLPRNAVRAASTHAWLDPQWLLRNGSGASTPAPVAARAQPVPSEPVGGGYATQAQQEADAQAYVDSWHNNDSTGA